MSTATFNGGGRTRALQVRRSANARRMRLSVDPRDGSVRLTLPRRAGLRQALAWVEERRSWVEAELDRLEPPRVFGPGATFLLEGVPCRIEWQPDASRTIHREPGRILLGGPAEMVAARVLRWLRREALTVLERETRELAEREAIEVARVSVGDPRARWGSCSSEGDIRYSWRLILMPPEVRHAIVAHEVAHRLHMDHSPAFHDAVARLHGRDPSHARRWLRANAAEIHWLGRDQ